MGRMGWMLAGGLLVLAAQATRADDDRATELFFGSADCGKGSVEFRLDCLNRRVEQIMARLDGRDVPVVPLATPSPPAPAPRQ